MYCLCHISRIRKSKATISEHEYGAHTVHPWAGEDLSLKIDERDQTTWNCKLEL